MKPSIGRTVWCIFDEELYRHEVGYVGKDSFMIDVWNDVVQSAAEYMYDEYQTSWFTSFARAKKTLLLLATKQHKARFRVVKRADDWYTLEEISDDTRKKSAK